MFLLYLTFLIGAIFTPSIGSKLPVVFDIENAKTLFEKFLITYNKTYSDAEVKIRLEIFQKTLTTLNVINSADTATFGINQFADLTEEEVFRGHTEDNQKLFQCGCSKITDDDIETRDAPSSLDWRDSGAVSRVKNEGDCRAHWAFAIVGNIEGQYAKAKGEILEFSVQELIDCLSDCDGCGGCSSREALSSLIDLGGLQLDSDYPYVKKQQRTCKYKPALSKVEVTGCINYNLYDEDNLKEVLAKRGPLYIAINGTPLKNYYNGILSNCPAGNLNHAVLLVGYGTEDNTDYWLIKNSWGPKWGVNGFAKIRRGVNACGLMNPQTASAIIE